MNPAELQVTAADHVGGSGAGNVRSGTVGCVGDLAPVSTVRNSTINSKLTTRRTSGERAGLPQIGDLGRSHLLEPALETEVTPDTGTRQALPRTTDMER